MHFSKLRPLAIAAGVGAVVALGFVYVSQSAGRSAADIGTPPDADAAIAKLKVKPARVDTPWREAMRVRDAIKQGDYPAARRMTAEVEARTHLQNWRYFPFDDFITYVSDLSDPTYEAHLNAWVAQDSKDPIPLLLRAQFECDMAWFKRGHRYNSLVPLARLALFGRLMKKALADAKAAIRLDAHNPYSFYLALRILQGAGARKDMGAIFKQAVAKYPHYYPLYEILLHTLTPKWGGSVPAMYLIVDRFAGNAAENSPIRLLYLSLYRELLGVAYDSCGSNSSDKSRTAQCVTAVARKIIKPDLGTQARQALQLYDHTDKYQFGLVVKDILFDMLETPGADAYSGAMLESAAAAMHSDTQLVEDTRHHNNYLIDEAVSESWYAKGFYDNALKKDKEALKDVETTVFPSEDEKVLAVAGIFNDMAAVYNKLNEATKMVAYEKAAVGLGRGNGSQVFICYGYYRLKAYQKAIAACSKTLKEQTDHLQPRYWRGSAYRYLGKTDAALRDLRAVADSESDYRVSAAIDMSVIYDVRKDFKSSIDVLNKYTYLYNPKLDSKADIAVSYNNRCYSYMKLGKLKKALADCTKSLHYGSIPDAIRKEKKLLQRLKTQERTF